jgi:hypothetical protein
MFDPSDDSCLTDSNPSATRNQLSYWCLAFEVRTNFQRLLKIQHRLQFSRRVKPCRLGRIEKG